MKRHFVLIVLMLSTGWADTQINSNTVKHVFVYQSVSAKAVYVAGTFNNWSPVANPMRFDGNGNWKLELELKPNYYQYKFIVDGAWVPDPMNNWKINDGGDNFNSIVRIGNPPTPQRAKSSRVFPNSELPEPVLEKDPPFVELYYAAWQMAWNKIKQGTTENGFEPYYMDEGFNELIYQWDLCFIASFAIYGRSVFPAMPSLDNFYKKQRSDGYIQRVYWETNGKIANEPTPDEPMVNPPLFAWVGWRYYQISGDSSRFRSVLPVLAKYYEWTEKNLRTKKGKGLFYNTALGSGMDNIPRKNVKKVAWIDYSAQQALATHYIAKIAKEVGDTTTYSYYMKRHNEIKNRINKFLWNPKTYFFYDLTENDTLSSTMHIGAYWTLISETCTSEKIPYMVAHLINPAEFWRPHLVPALAANQPEYDPKGHYWRGGVWAPTDYIVIRGLMAYDQYSLADSIAYNHLDNISDIYFNFKPLADRIAFDERYNDDYQTLWECYSAELSEPATRWDNTFYSRQDFVGWTGLGPIALLIENILGVDISGIDNCIKWTIKRTDRHGIKNIQLRDQKVSLVFEYQKDKPTVTVTCERPFILKVRFNDIEYEYDIKSSSVMIL
jgi:hypothetical protein